ncbi:hypothetical protein ASPVEDRAFT_70028 [Aspergillus versicolor CBS 583.65]|uniref:C2H2-type domain-containing protein n=1 Tax=Aspergillus versicolor CBS 583.65 TaxID=1036611 RepID=A0A1L9PE19_ASPVE|nr:uncharacterized protein ASPVEDRAFT_70028 [Aspergillus versicolor CBS 583.65]OJI99694.1 hypothetical protein ASPVEDRAFT_70028 [Aspergillus versicolor CBS 583.65]
MDSSPSNCGWHSAVRDDMRHYLAGTPGPSPPIDTIPPESVLLNWHDIAPCDYILSHFIPQTSAQALGSGDNSPYDNQAPAVCRDTDAPANDGLSDFYPHRPSNIQPQLAGQSSELGAPLEPYIIDPPVQVQTERPRLYQSASKPRRRRAAPRSKAQENRINKQQPVAGTFKCKWEDCPNTDGFSRKGELQRHVITIHLSPRSFECPKTNCEWAFNRKDNLGQHLDRVHEPN